ncbi:MAG: class I SAM-dependent methyltransferase [Actinomycetota bacterium]|nr:class I SAM-dependent methyltransferase [Actinomycetota bacterium]
MSLDTDRLSSGAAGGAVRPMAADAYEAMARVERTQWWFRAKRHLVADALARHQIASDKPIVDVGAGTGGLLHHLDGRGPIVGLELDPEALTLARAAVPGVPLVQAVAERLPVRTGVAGAVTALDVLEHLDDDEAALRELSRVAGDGLLILTVPAYAWAWSDHDVRLGHRRRYTRSSLLAVAERADLEVLRITYFHSWLVPIAWLVRRTPIGRLLPGSAEDASFVNHRVNAFLGRVVGVERRVLHRFDLPIGLSILLVARRR